MQSRIAAASFHSLSAGICSRNIRDAVSLRSIVNFFGSRHLQINSRHSFAVEDDAFSELGPEQPERSTKQIKLVTEKRDHYVKTEPSRREVAKNPPSSYTRPQIKDIVSTIGKASPSLNSNLGVQNKRVSKITDDTEKTSDIESPRTISVKNICSTVGLCELVEAISRFGKVSSASFSNASNGLRCCNVEFENFDSRSRAISAGKITVGSKVVRIHPVDDVDVVAVRIENINEETSDYSIHSKCKSVGEFVGLARTNKDAVEAFFSVRSKRSQLSILKKLNGIVVDEKPWSAHVSTSTEELLDQEASYELNFQIFNDLKRRNHIERVCLEDLENLHRSIIHLQGMPHVSDLSGSN